MINPCFKDEIAVRHRLYQRNVVLFEGRDRAKSRTWDDKGRQKHKYHIIPGK